MRTIRQHPRSRIVVNDVYAYSEAVRCFGDSVRELSASDPIRKITVEFTKNRELDVANGRFVDTQYGEAGYELFHMLSILRSILPADDYRAYLRAAPVSVTSEMRVRTLVEGLPEIELYTSSAGFIAYADLAGFAFSEPVAKDCTTHASIPYGTEFRYRVADVELDSGTHVTLVFEPRFGSSVDFKNMHSVHVRDAAHVRDGVSQHHFMISGNHFEEALLAQLELLHSVEEGTALIRLAELRRMAALSTAVSTGTFPQPSETDQPGDPQGNDRMFARLGSGT
ncbi:hypothetical protein FHS29_006998 [Saccharothrix tamanrassetensis]|uniref:Uncharacterized protein n=1 Tax=Saccharothrix tamanrassetensis TaxID=1051531 RepID=A0A841CWP5_9PSEU|nr:hypothetical protein [Saccharothrix tamanrassetensis]MBB5960375.1 hypothetical protein [Saccharothrix tamanrassetensis]